MADSEREEGSGSSPLTDGSEDEEVSEVCLTKLMGNQRGDRSCTHSKAQSLPLRETTVKTENSSL